MKIHGGSISLANLLKYNDLCAKINAVVIRMEGNIVNNFFKNIKNKINNKNNKNIHPQSFEYAFSMDEVRTIEKQNDEKIKNLNKSFLKTKNKSSLNREKEANILDSINNDLFLGNEKKEDKEILNMIDDDDNFMNYVKDNEINNLDKSCVKEENQVYKYSNPDSQMKEMITSCLTDIDILEIDKYISDGKKILEQSYSVTFMDDALRYIYSIRDKYNILIEYLIGFNNEKRGLFNKTTFSDKVDNDWRYLKNYVNLLERIKKLKR